MRTHDIIVAIHQTRKMGDKTKFGPDRLDSFGAAAGVSNLSSRPEGHRLWVETARKIGRNWVIDDSEPWPDRRVKSGKYIKSARHEKAK